MMIHSAQRGVIFLAMVLVLFVTGSTLMLGALNNRQQTALAQQAELHVQMDLAKSALLAFAANSAEFSNHANGPGFFPCPVIDSDEVEPPTTCDDDVPLVGRLPDYVDLPDSRFYINDYYSDVGLQFWYVVAPRYVYWSAINGRRRAGRRTSTTDTTNATPFRLKLDETTEEYVAFIIAPGEELETQNRSAGPENYANYLDGLNGASDFDYYTRYDSNPSAFNDQIIGITLDEYVVYVGSAAARAIKTELDEYHLASAASPQEYPQSSTLSSQFKDAFDDDHMWLRDDTSGAYLGNRERWSTDSVWTRVSSDSGKLYFTGCPGIEFTFTYNGATPIIRDGDSCTP